jgi:hypothetical protein
MRSEVTVTLPGAAPVTIDLDHVAPMARDDGRQWLDRQFTELGCEPLRPTGKVLTADKVMVVAEAAGQVKFSDKVWAQEFARAASATLDKPVIGIDVGSMTISY